MTTHTRSPKSTTTWRPPGHTSASGNAIRWLSLHEYWMAFLISAEVKWLGLNGLTLFSCVVSELGSFLLLSSHSFHSCIWCHFVCLGIHNSVRKSVNLLFADLQLVLVHEGTWSHSFCCTSGKLTFRGYFCNYATCHSRVSDRKAALEEALNFLQQFYLDLDKFLNWLTEAETTCNVLIDATNKERLPEQPAAKNLLAQWKVGPSHHAHGSFPSTQLDLLCAWLFC